MPDLFPVCDGCGHAITDGEPGHHLHHNSLVCPWLPPEDYSEADLLLHEITCDHQLIFHEHCCTQCGAQFASI